VRSRTQLSEITDNKATWRIVAPAGTDFFLDPTNGVHKGDAPFYCRRMKGDFAASVIVQPEFRKTYDAGGLLVMESSRRWIKLAFELTDLGCPSVVSVVTAGSSDDCNGERVQDGSAIHLQIVRQGEQWALHYSLKGRRWRMVRYFRLKMKAEVKVGVEAQSPAGQGCRVTFRRLRLAPGSVENLRQGR
jgi:uncharacterized protein